ncbi:plasmid mobilization relaxosome protein MobC, partial [Citrobacter sp. Res13-Lact-LER2-35-b]
MPDYKERYQRKNFISLCLSDEELSEVENIADRLNMKRAAAAREILVTNSKRLKSQIKKNDNSEILFLYSKISNNINQIAKKMNTNLDKFL